MSSTISKNNIPDYWLLLLTLALLAIGTVMVYSISSVVGFNLYNDSFYFIRRHLLSIIAGMVLAVGAYSVDISFYKKIAPWGLLLSPLLLLLTYIPLFSVTIGGSSRWVDIFGLRFQPSEFVKLFLILYVASALVNKDEEIKDFFYGVLPILIVIGLNALLILASPDLGTTFVLSATVLFMLTIGGANIWYILVLFLIGFRFASWLIWRTPYQKQRLLAFLNPWADPLGKGFHLLQSLIAIGAGGFLGVGIGQSSQKFSYLPQQFTDFIFSITCEEGGFVLGATIIIFILLLTFRGFRIALFTRDRFVQILAAGISFLLFLEAIFNIMVTTGLVPPKGIVLPFVSYGGSSMVASLVMVGILANLSRRVS